MKNQYEVRGAVTAIFLNRKNGEVLEALISTSDLERVKEFPNTWYANYSPFTKTFYCDGNITIQRKNRIRVRLHRWITNCPADMKVDHFNNDTLDNQRKNLRIANNAENMQNRAGASRNSRSGIRGVYRDKQRQVWRSVITIQGKHIHIGRYNSIFEAELAVMQARAIYMNFSKEAKEVAI